MGRARGWGRWGACALLVAAGAARAGGGEPAWETISQGPIVVKVRSLRGTDAREIWAEGELNAEVQDLEAAILDAEEYPRFMPYVKATRTLERGPDGSVMWALLEPPLISPRDYVVKVEVHRRSGPDGRGDFANAWRSAPDWLPKRPSVVRLPICEGGWTVTHAGPGRSHVVYRASVDPGAWMPGFVSDLANRTGAVGTMKAVEKEAQRRGEERRAQAANEVRRAEPAR